MRNINTDLAVEAHEYYVGDGINAPEGVLVDHEDFENIHVITVKIVNEEGERLLQKKQGRYVTIEFSSLSADIDTAAAVLAKKLKNILSENNINADDDILVVGLGNHNITPDALGPKAISKLDITRHLFELMPHFLTKGTRSVSALAPGVLGNTGIETGEIIKAVTEKTKPAAVIAIDALASRSTLRVGRTIQIADTGIHPGSGVGNNRKGLNCETLNLPVIAIGVPTVVDAATVADDAFESAINAFKEDGESSFGTAIANMDDSERYSLIRRIMGEDMANMMVTPKEIDNIIDSVSTILADGINAGLHD